MDTGRDPARRGWDGECSPSRCRRSVPGQAEPGEGAAYERGRSGASQGSGPRPAWPVPVGRLLYPRRGGGFPRRGLLQSVHRRVLFILAVWFGVRCVWDGVSSSPLVLLENYLFCVHLILRFEV